MNTTRTTPRPRIVLCASDYARLSALSESMSRTPTPTIEYLSEELSRAHIVPDEDFSTHVVRIGSRVTYSDEASGRTHKVEVVYPREADISRGRISVLTPIGAALIGLCPAQSIDWPNPQGGQGTLTVLDVSNETEEAEQSA